MSELEMPGTFAIYVTYDPDKVSEDEVRDGLMANRDAIAREILAGLQPLMMEGQAGFQVQIGGLPPGTNFVFGGPQGPAQ
jgi:hypothetical protein